MGSGASPKRIGNRLLDCLPLEELNRLHIEGGEKNKGLMAVLQRMEIAPVPLPAPNKPSALDLVPFQAAMLISTSASPKRTTQRTALTWISIWVPRRYLMRPSLPLRSCRPMIWLCRISSR